MSLSNMMFVCYIMLPMQNFNDELKSTAHNYKIQVILFQARGP